MKHPGPAPHEYELARTEERWIIEGGEPRLIELRADRGISRTRERGDATIVTAHSLPAITDPSARGGDADRLLSLLFDGLPPGQRIRVRRVHARRTVTREGSAPFAHEHTLVSIRNAEGVGLVSPLSEEAVEDLLDLAALFERGEPTAIPDPSRHPIAWLNGTGSVLLHEAIGHPAEISAPPVQWPDWLRVVDDPLSQGLGHMPTDDTGEQIRPSDLTRGEIPRAFRRESYRDVPRRRLTNLVVEGSKAPIELPESRIEVLLLAGGQWDPLSDGIELRVIRARHVRGDRIRELLPFTYRVDRKTLARKLAGTRGSTVAYPGVLCSDEGQRVEVGSVAPVLITEAIEP